MARDALGKQEEENGMAIKDVNQFYYDDSFLKQP